jgi:hypothetical protein
VVVTPTPYSTISRPSCLASMRMTRGLRLKERCLITCANQAEVAAPLALTSLTDFRSHKTPRLNAQIFDLHLLVIRQGQTC